MKTKIILLTFSTLIAFLSTEIVLRLFWINPYANTTADKVLKIRVPHKNINLISKRDDIDAIVPQTYRTNNRNYIEPSFRFHSPDFTIVFMGGSTTECIAVQEKQRFPFLVSKYLEDKGLKVNTLNAARSGGTLHDSINILFNHVILDHPDVIVLMHAANDIGVIKEDSYYQSRMGHDISFSDVGNYTLQLLSIHSSFFGFVREGVTARIDFLEDNYTLRPDTSEIDANPFKARLQIFMAMCRALGIKPVLMTQPLAASIKNDLTPDWTDQTTQSLFNLVIREVSASTNTDIIDLVSLLFIEAKSKDELRRIFYDGVHVTDYGSSLYASYIAESLYKILTKEQ